ncbi:MAG: DEAD/DEAH box helicase family protein [Clostridia bacterium]
MTSTGTGKTYGAAFAMRDAAPGKALFVVHREQIAKQARKIQTIVFFFLFGKTKMITRRRSSTSWARSMSTS